MELHKKYWPGWEGETEVRQMLDGPDCRPEPVGSHATSKSGRG
jgi:hypothetical protein